MTHNNMNKNVTETNQGTLEKVMEAFPDDTSPAMMEDRGSKELDDINQNYFNEENETGLDDEEGEEST